MENNDVVIRAYQAADKDELSSIWYRASLKAHNFLGEETILEQRKLIEDVYLEKAENWVACVDGKPIGFVGLLDNFIGGLFIDPDVQGRGAGRALVAHARALKGELSLEVYTANTGACAFYNALGFREISRRPEDDHGLPFENMLMRLDA
ncbi:MAG: GNAT family N-acetyltransferase [Sphingopyxis sp.]|uniref:GNAT family N-acetyltransferase n=1 Tax=Sphingopyxis sp. TaxID=1908224 RepID=UPI002AB8432C|nr:GNAT family N-acetyltransferase [Sphingopyxis sp.]MDZ3830979.1 GNAT family N-acetyltransferase [Sphingopyxis sp.]